MVFMNVAATIPTGALAERWRFSALTAYAVFMSTILYPVYACWVWGGGWLSQLGLNFGLGNGHVDLAGATVVHMTGGVTALAGARVLGPRIGKFNADGSANPIPGHNIPMVVVGTLILALGWLGLNVAGTVNEFEGVAIRVALCTMLASAAGCCTAMLSMWVLYGKPDPTMGCNGLLAGLVAITAGCAFITPAMAVFIGGIAGMLVASSVLFVEKSLRLDDPVGAVSVHGVCGAFGALCVGLLADGSAGSGWNGVVKESPLGLFNGGGVAQLAAQAVGVVANLLWSFPVALGFFMLLNRFWGMRVTARDEIAGLDIPELGVSGYVDEEPIDVKRAGQDHLSQHGPGVPVTDSHKAPRPEKPPAHGRP